MKIGGKEKKKVKDNGVFRGWMLDGGIDESSRDISRYGYDMDI